VAKVLMTIIVNWRLHTLVYVGVLKETGQYSHLRVFGSTVFVDRPYHCKTWTQDNLLRENYMHIMTTCLTILHAMNELMPKCSGGKTIQQRPIIILINMTSAIDNVGNRSKLYIIICVDVPKPISTCSKKWEIAFLMCTS